MRHSLTFLFASTLFIGAAQSVNAQNFSARSASAQNDDDKQLIGGALGAVAGAVVAGPIGLIAGAVLGYAMEPEIDNAPTGTVKTKARPRRFARGSGRRAPRYSDGSGYPPQAYPPQNYQFYPPQNYPQPQQAYAPYAGGQPVYLGQPQQLPPQQAYGAQNNAPPYGQNYPIAPALQPAAAYQPTPANPMQTAQTPMQPQQIYNPRQNPIVPAPGQVMSAGAYGGAFGAVAPGQAYSGAYATPQAGAMGRQSFNQSPPPAVPMPR